MNFFIKDAIELNTFQDKKETFKYNMLNKDPDLH